jgi:hypothetical protein
VLAVNSRSHPWQRFVTEPETIELPVGLAAVITARQRGPRVVDVYLPQMSGARPMAALVRAGHHGLYGKRPDGPAAAVGRWAALFPVVMCVCLVYWGARLWTLAVVLAACAVAVLAPVVAAEATHSILLSSVTVCRMSSTFRRDC